MRSLDEIEAHIEELNRQLYAAKAEKQEVLLLAVEREYGVRVGSIVVMEGKEYSVSQIDTTWGESKPWLMGSPKKKDGTFSTAVRNLFRDWELKQQ